MNAKKTVLVAAMLATAVTFAASAVAEAASFGFHVGPVLNPTLRRENELAIWNRFTPDQPMFNWEIGDENARSGLIQAGLFGGPQKLTAEQIAKYHRLVEAVIAHDRKRVDAITKTFTLLDWMGLEIGITRVPEERNSRCCGPCRPIRRHCTTRPDRPSSAT